MFELLWTVLIYPLSLLRPQHELAKEVLALRHQITVFKRRTHRPKLRSEDVVADCCPIQRLHSIAKNAVKMLETTHLPKFNVVFFAKPIFHLKGPLHRQQPTRPTTSQAATGLNRIT